METRNFVLRILINAIAIAVAAALIPGIQATSEIGPLLLIGLVLTITNAILKPILIFLTCPAVILTLGLFIFVINAVVLRVAGSIVGESLTIDGWGAAILGGVAMAIVNMVLEGALGLNKPDSPQGKPKR